MDKQEKQKVYAILDWAKQQIEICLENKQKVENIYPGSIYFASLGIGIGSEQAKDRPVLVIDSYKTSSVCIVVPLTSERLNDNKSYHIDLSNNVGTVLLEQIRAISKTRITSAKVNGIYLRITEEERSQINEQLAKICQIKYLQKY